MPMNPGPRTALALLALIGGFSLSGCSGSERPVDASPIVDAHSEQALRAQSEAEQLLKLRQQQEAAARKRHRSLPAEG